MSFYLDHGTFAIDAKATIGSAQDTAKALADLDIIEACLNEAGDDVEAGLAAAELILSSDPKSLLQSLDAPIVATVPDPSPTLSLEEMRAATILSKYQRRHRKAQQGLLRQLDAALSEMTEHTGIPFGAAVEVEAMLAIQDIAEDQEEQSRRLGIGGTQHPAYAGPGNPISAESGAVGAMASAMLDTAREMAKQRILEGKAQALRGKGKGKGKSKGKGKRKRKKSGPKWLNRS